MMQGVVSGRHALLMLTLRGLSNQGNADVALDTGFTGQLTLPPAAIAALGLPLDHYRPATLADGSTILMAVHKAVILWDGAERSIDVLEAEGLPLLGTSLLDGYEVLIEFKDGGRVVITRLP